MRPPLPFCGNIEPCFLLKNRLLNVRNIPPFFLFYHLSTYIQLCLHLIITPAYRQKLPLYDVTAENLRPYFRFFHLRPRCSRRTPQIDAAYRQMFWNFSAVVETVPPHFRLSAPAEQFFTAEKRTTTYGRK
ncbi:unnamed protein product [Ectocarpus sp. 12 AP-2014]